MVIQIVGQYFWLIAFIVLFVIEILTLGLTTIWFAGGSLAAFIAQLLGANLIIQIIVFVVVSVVLLVFTRPIVKKHFNNNRTLTNAESLKGESGTVMETIDTLRAVGRVNVKGREWAAKTEDPEGVIQVGQKIIVKEIKGVHLIVTNKEEA
ncbi:MAG: NfeD family protein [Suipraeoptans sp.]